MCRYSLCRGTITDPYPAEVVFVASRSGLWRFNATIQLSTSSIVRFVVAGPTPQLAQSVSGQL
ncbi:MAG: hypothetical protein H7836_02010 [Magnetococcus sp. YQC-3]